MDAMDATSPHKRRRTAQDCVVLDVGGTLFKSTISTLTSSCTYFASLFSHEWAPASESREIYLDRDPDAFKVLLSCLRNHVALLPETDPDLCKRVLLEAEFFGVEWLLRDVKHQTLRHEPYSAGERGRYSGWDPSASTDVLKDPARAAQKFDELFGGLRDALRTGVLPSRFFRKADPYGAQAKVRHLVPAPLGDRVVFSDSTGTDVASARPIAYALVEEPSGNQYMDAVIASRHPPVRGRAGELNLHNSNFLDYDEQMVLATAFVDQRADWSDHNWGIVQGASEGGHHASRPALEGDMPGLVEMVD